MGFENAESTMRHLVHISTSMNTFSTYQIALIVLFVVMVNIDLEKMSACSKTHKCLLDILRDNLLGTLQKLSLKRRIQSSLISGGVVEYLLDTLGADVVDEKSNSTKKQLFVLTDYALEYCTALLMNLCLRSLGRMKAADHGAEKLLGIMTELLRHDDIEVRPYTNGILYTMLQDKRVWDEAQKINLKDMINVFSDNIQKI